MLLLLIVASCTLAAVLNTPVSAGYKAHLYTTSNDGGLRSLSLSVQGREVALELQSTTDACGAQPVWLDFDRDQDTLYCLAREGSVTSLLVSQYVNLSPVDSQNTTIGPVSNAFYNRGNRRGLVLAHYAGSAVTAYNAPPNGSLELIQTLVFDSPTGPKPSQNLPHPHDAVLDPTGRFIVVPDLGADLLRIFTFDPDTNFLMAMSGPRTAPGSGPRHCVFWSPEPTYNGTGPLYLHVIAELSSTIISYRVTYPPAGGINLAEIGVRSAYGGPVAPAGVGAEIDVSPDNRFIIASNRNDSSFLIPNLNPSNYSAEPSDSLSVWRPMDDGSLTFVQLAAAGGLWPRHFQTNGAGNLIAVSLQYSHRVAIMERNVETGLIGPIVAHLDEIGEAVMTLWDED